MAKQVLNRKEYKDIKKMDHNQMSDFMERIYMRGFEAGKKSASGLSEDETREAILQIKGSGRIRIEGRPKGLLPRKGAILYKGHFCC